MTAGGDGEFAYKVLDALSSHIAVLDGDGRVIATNRAWREFAEQVGEGADDLGVGARVSEGADYLGMCIRASERREAGWEEAATAASLIREMIAGRRTEGTLEYAWHAPEEQRWFLCRITRFPGEGLARVVVAHSNITARKQADLGAIRSQKQFRGLFEAAPDALILANAQGSITLLNRRAEAIFGYAHEELIGQPIERLIPEAQRLNHVGLRQGFLRAGIPREMGQGRHDLFGQRKDGTTFPVEISLSPMESSEGPSVVAAIRDVTDRRRKEQALKLSEERFRTLFEKSRDALVILAPPLWRITSCNAAALAMFGARDEADIISHPAWKYSPRLQDGRDPELRAMEMIEMARRNGWHVFDRTFQRLTGETFPASVLLSRIEVEGESVLMASIRDESERRSLQASVAQAQRLATIGTLAAGVAHEINTPIQFVSHSIAFLRDAAEGVFKTLEKLQSVPPLVLEEAPPEQQREAIRAANEAAEAADLLYVTEEVPKAFDTCIKGLARVAAIVRSLQEFASPEQSEMSSVDLNQAILNVLTISRNEYQHVADVDTDLGQLPRVMCHRANLNQVIFTLLINAIHAIADVVQDSGQMGRITIRTRAEGDDVVIAITDTGTGISEEVRPRIFDPFFTTKEVGKGIGQGLAVARSIVVDKHGGRLTFDTEVGKGTTFLIRLPTR